jgi:hypothetical protein
LLGCEVGDSADCRVSGCQSADVIEVSGDTEVGQQDSLFIVVVDVVSMMLAA